MVTWYEINEGIRRCRMIKDLKKKIECLMSLMDKYHDGMVAYNLGEVFEEREMHTWALFYYSAAKDLFLKPEFKAKATAALTRLAKLGHQFPEKKPRIFIVHGHDDAMKHEVARTLEKLDLDPIILHEQPNKGRTIIEKITDYSNVSFAIVLFSPDDVAHPVGAPEKVKKRARPNVVLELGYFLGRLGRERVIVLLKKDENFEIPSDFLGVLYIPFDKSWPLNLIKELKNRGLYIDANKLVD